MGRSFTPLKGFPLWGSWQTTHHTLRPADCSRDLLRGVKRLSLRREEAWHVGNRVRLLFFDCPLPASQSFAEDCLSVQKAVNRADAGPLPLSPPRRTADLSIEFIFLLWELSVLLPMMVVTPDLG